MKTQSTKSVQCTSAPSAEFVRLARRAPEHPLQRFVDSSRRQTGQSERVAQLQGAPVKVNPEGLPHRLRAGIEELSGTDMSDVVVHRDSSKPAQLNALAYAQGNEIHLGPGQERHLPHEAWHVVQQAQGRVRPTVMMDSGVQVNDNAGLEREATAMGDRAAALPGTVQEKRMDSTGARALVPDREPGPVGSRTKNSMPIQGIGFLGTALLGAGVVLGGSVLHDLYQRYKRYVKPADRSAAHLGQGGVHGQTENPALNVEQGLDTFRQMHALRNARQDDTRAHLSWVGSAMSRFLRPGHSDIDEVLMRTIRSEFPGRDDISEEEFEFAIQKATMGGTRTRGGITAAARVVGGAAEAVGL